MKVATSAASNFSVTTRWSLDSHQNYLSPQKTIDRVWDKVLWCYSTERHWWENYVFWLTRRVLPRNSRMRMISRLMRTRRAEESCHVKYRGLITVLLRTKISFPAPFEFHTGFLPKVSFQFYPFIGLPPSSKNLSFCFFKVSSKVFPTIVDIRWVCFQNQ